jgi:hypothetical protein
VTTVREGLEVESMLPPPTPTGCPPWGTAVAIVIVSDPVDGVSVAEHRILSPVATHIRVPGQQ